MKHILLFLLISLSLLASSCIQDEFSVSPAHQPVCSTDTLDFGTLFTEEASPVASMMIRNPNGKGLHLNNVRISGPDAACFRLNVDGMAGTAFEQVDVRANDSLFVFVQALLPQESGQSLRQITAYIEFDVNGVTNRTVLRAEGQNVRRLRAPRIDTDTHLTAEVPYIIYDSLVVAPDVRLTLDPGVRLLMHSKAYIKVEGSLHAEGTVDAPVRITGDRLGYVAGNIPYDVVPNMWDGIYFTTSSHGNSLSHTTIMGGSIGLSLNVGAELSMLNCTVQNMGINSLYALHAKLDAAGCIFADAPRGVVTLTGGEHLFTNCTFGNYYLFGGVSGPCINLFHISDDPKEGYDDGSGLPYTKANFNNCIIWDRLIAIDLVNFDVTELYFRNCLTNDEDLAGSHFTNCVSCSDPMFYLPKRNALAQYTPAPESPAVGIADTTLIPERARYDATGADLFPSRIAGARVAAPHPAEK